MAVYVPGEAQSALMRGRARLVSKVVEIIGGVSSSSSVEDDREVATTIVDRLLAEGVFSSDFFADESVTPQS